MNTKKAILCGALLWVLIFFEVSILMFGFKLSMGTTAYYVLHYILLVILVVISSMIYFDKAKKSNSRIKEGLLLGIVFLVVGAILDSAITIPLFLNMDYSFFFSFEMLLSNILVLVVSMAVGLIKK